VKTATADYYALLGIASDATAAQIKSAYRKLAKQYHPDVNNSSDAAEKFREITEAYDTLTDPDRRRRYDRLHGPRTHTGTGTPGDTSNGSTRTGNSSRTRAQNGSTNGSDGSQAASRILKILEDTWLEIRRWHPEIPPVVIIIASGTEGKHPRWGYHAPDRWNVAGLQYAEIMISGEGLRRSPADVLGTLLHEAAHALAHARGIKDTSRQSRYHNKQFKNCAEELGLTTEHDQRNGWSASTITKNTEAAYARQLAALGEAMTLWRHGETLTGTTPRRTSNFIAAICPCGRSIRLAASTLAEAPITCAACDGKFQAKTA
jgi:curved DNA-binding protein CbpA